MSEVDRVEVDSAEAEAAAQDAAAFEAEASEAAASNVAASAAAVGDAAASDAAANEAERGSGVIESALIEELVEDLRERWPGLPSEERVVAFVGLPEDAKEDFFAGLSSRSQSIVLLGLAENHRRHWFRTLAPDDAADVLQWVELDERDLLLGLLDRSAQNEVKALLAYAEDEAGGLMNPRFARLRPDMTIDQAIAYLRRQARTRLETIYYAYVLDAGQRPIGVVSFRDLFAMPGDRAIWEVMVRDPITVEETADQESVTRLIAQHDLLALPVVDPEGRMKGIVTVDDAVDVVQEEATEDFQKVGGMAALDASYLQTGLLEMVKKRAGWLSVLFVGEMLTASAMGFFEGEIAQAVVLALFVPLIISSGGNAGSQAATLIIRAMALEEVRFADAWRIVRRELGTGLLLGLILCALGVLRITIWQTAFGTYGAAWYWLAATVGISLVGVVTWGTLAGAALPIVIERLGFDPASASAPFVATLVDVFGLVIYFSVARLFLSGTLL